ncbi:acylphosphatase [Roseovarius sp. SYSU LYC5161]|uniref:acylphosphatase n=1 Tax=Roseovarius halophilus (ex Wu et al. 2025) TaxID=3376060 RepID=UPI002871135B|nr:acylphosphatase [Roseovarius sp.]
MTRIKAVHARVTGRVQGVSFRAWTEAEALARGLSGWVRNEADGAVTAVIAGPPPDVDAMLSALWDGPPAARVSDVQTSPADPPEAADFTIRR